MFIETIVIPDDVDGVQSEGSGVGCDVSFSHSDTGANFIALKLTRYFVVFKFKFGGGVGVLIREHLNSSYRH